MRTDKQIKEDRYNQVAKSNDLIQKARYNLSTMELKTLSFVMSMIKPTDNPGQRYTFSITDYCRVRGIDASQANTRSTVKASLKALHDKSFWVQKGPDKEVLCTWIEKPEIEKGQVSIRFDPDIEEYIMGLIEKGRYTQYELLYTLPMKSGYSIRLYELLKSYIDFKNSNKPNKFGSVKQDFSMEELRIRIGSTVKDDKGKVVKVNYPQFREFKRNILDIAVKEIKEYTDLDVEYAKICKGRTVTGIQFEIKYKDSSDLLQANVAVEKVLDRATQIPGQMSIFDRKEEDS